MKIIDVNSIEKFEYDCGVSIGFFDGLHVGHQEIIKKLVNETKNRKYKSVVITFDNSLLYLFKVQESLMTLDEKLDGLEWLGVDYVVILKEKDNFMNLSAIEFINKYLDRLNCKLIVCGNDLSFAKNREGKIDFIKHNTNYELCIVDDVYVNNIKVSSSYIRKLKKENETEAYNLLYKKNRVN